MAPMWHLGVKSLCWMLHALVLMTTPQEIQTASVTELPRVSCTDIHSEAFGNETLKPGVCYRVGDSRRTFSGARTKCQQYSDTLGWDMADIEDAVEHQLIHDAIAALKAAGSILHMTSFWVGQNDMKTEGVWRYVNDSSNKCNRTVYLKWANGQPDGGRRANCVLYNHATGNFSDVGCDGFKQYLCKVKLSSETVPFCPNFTEDKEAPDECVNILPDAFGNPSVPGVCYAGDGDQTRTFEEALSFCRSLPGGNWSVPDIEDADENLFLEVWIRDNFPTRNDYWIGQNDREQEGDFQYTSSRQCPVYLNWRSTQPDGLREHNCLTMSKDRAGTFFDKPCSYAGISTLCKLKAGSNQTGGSLTRCDKPLATEVAACSSLRADAFGRLDKPGVCYFMTGKELRWTSAVSYCKNEGWSLVDIEDATENEMLAIRYRNFAPSGREYLVGQNDRENEGTWKYSSDDTPSDAGVFLNWKSGESYIAQSRDCIAMATSGYWTDRACKTAFFVTCKKHIDIPPAYTCNNSLSVTARPGHFVFLSSDATCNPQDTLAPSYRAKGRIQCARDCLIQDDCQGFGFVAAGKEDDCVLCSKVLDVNGLQFKAGSLYYNKAL